MRRGRKPVVVDTNVPITANRRNGGSYACASACAQELMALRKSGTLVLDRGGLILAEYRNYLNYKGEPGAGDAFFRWFFNNRGKTDLCREIPITPIAHQWRQFEEFPDDETLSNFDKADQKFVSAAIAVKQGASVLQASDHKWLNWHNSLEAHGVEVRFLCKAELFATQNRKKAVDVS